MRILLTLLTALLVSPLSAQNGVSAVIQCGTPSKTGQIEFRLRVFDTKHNKLVEETVTVREIKADDSADDKAKKVENTIQAHLDGNSVLDAAVNVGRVGNVVAVTSDNPDVGSTKIDKVKDGTGEKMTVDDRKDMPPASPGMPYKQRVQNWELGTLFALEGTPIPGGVVGVGIDSCSTTVDIVSGDTALMLLYRIRQDLSTQGVKTMIIHPWNAIAVLDPDRDGDVHRVFTDTTGSGLNILWERIYQ